MLKFLLRSILLFSVVGSNLGEPCCECWNKCFPEPMNCELVKMFQKLFILGDAIN
jgi:hypothetical protein